MAAYFRSAVWLVGCSSLGYVLLMAVTPSDSFLADAKKTYPGAEKSPVESQKKKQQFVDVLQAVTDTNQPLHRLSKEEIEDLNRKNK